MGHKNRAGGSLRQQVYDELQKKNGFGRSKHEDKKAGISSRYIYSFNSMKTYLKHSFYFVEWCKNQDYIKGELNHKPRTLAESKAEQKQLEEQQKQLEREWDEPERE